MPLSSTTSLRARRSSAFRHASRATPLPSHFEVGGTRAFSGVACLAVSLIPVALGTRALRRRIAPSFAGPPAVLAEIVLFISLVVCVAEVLGTIALFRLA